MHSTLLTSGNRGVGQKAPAPCPVEMREERFLEHPSLIRGEILDDKKRNK
jgi:hypothetical protein